MKEEVKDDPYDSDDAIDPKVKKEVTPEQKQKHRIVNHLLEKFSNYVFTLAEMAIIREEF